MKLYCKNFKKLALCKYNNGVPIKKIIKQLGICRKTLYNWRYNKRYTCNKSKKINDKYNKCVYEYIKKYIINRSNFRMKNLQKLLLKKFNRKYTAYNIYYVLRKLNITYKKARKIIRINKREHNRKVKQIKQKVNQIGHDNIVSTDECHFHLNMQPNKGWNIKGKPVTFTKTTSNRTSMSLICSITNKKILHYEIHKSSINKDIFIKYLKKLNRRTYRKHLLMDNARIHHSLDVKKHMKGKTNKLLFNVPYNPETNPIEQVFSKVKYYVNKKPTTTIKQLTKAIEDALKTITVNDLQNYFKHSFIKKYKR
jgi:transposase